MSTLQFEIGRALAATGDHHAISELEGWLTDEDRHRRGNVAFVLARLGDPRGFDTIAQILADKSPRSQGQGTPFPRWTLDAQIRSDRYYAAHLLGDLKDPRGIELLVPLLNDTDLDDKAAWSLAEIGDRRAIGPLLEALERDESFDASGSDLHACQAERSRGPAQVARVVAGQQKIETREPNQCRRSGSSRDRCDRSAAVRYVVQLVFESEVTRWRPAGDPRTCNRLADGAELRTTRSWRRAQPRGCWA